MAEAKWGEEKIVVNGVTKLKFGNEVLQPVDDSFGECKEKQSGGHGVGLSGNGAEYMASQLGKKFDEIIKYYYKGVEIKNIFKSTDEEYITKEEKRNAEKIFFFWSNFKVSIFYF